VLGVLDKISDGLDECCVDGSKENVSEGVMVAVLVGDCVWQSGSLLGVADGSEDGLKLGD